MQRRKLILALTVGMLAATPALADYSQDVVRQLTEMGFDDVEVSRTLLGRVRITATGENGQREIILNPRTGEILRDLWLKANGSSSDPALLGESVTANSAGGQSGSGGSSGGGGSGSSGGGSDDSDDDGSDDSGGSDDSSGSGGGNGGGSDGDSGGDDSSGGNDGGDDKSGGNDD